MKRDPQSFAWTCVKGLLSIVGRKGTPGEGLRRDYDANAYPEEVKSAIFDAGIKAVMQQRTSDVVGEMPKLIAWDELDEQFADGVFALEGGGKGGPTIGVWIEVLAEVKGHKVGEMQAYLSKNYDKPGRAKLRKLVEEKYADRIQKVKDARSAMTIAGIDLSEI